MKDFTKRRDHFEFFESFEKPLLNICYELEVDDFRPHCKATGVPVFHFFLYALFNALNRVENFKYRIFQNEVIKIDQFTASYTVINDENLFNYTSFEYDTDLKKFVANSIAARDKAMRSSALVNSGIEMSERELKNYVFITSIPWLRFTSIEHPVFKFKSADIPSVSWGKFTVSGEGKLLVPFSVQAHHGFVDGYHIHLLGETLREEIGTLIKRA